MTAPLVRAEAEQNLWIFIRTGRDTVIGEMGRYEAPRQLVRNPLLLVGDGWQQVEVPLSPEEAEAERARRMFAPGPRAKPSPNPPSKLVWWPTRAAMLGVSCVGPVDEIAIDVADQYHASDEHVVLYRESRARLAAYFEQKRKSPSALTEKATDQDVTRVAAIVEGARNGAA